MVWWEDMDETRVLIAPQESLAGYDCYAKNEEDQQGCMLSLRHPKSGNSACYFFKGGHLQELHWFKQTYASWFLGDCVCEDGCMYISTNVDPVFIMLPIFEEARMKKENDMGMFRQLEEMIFIHGYPGYNHLQSIAEETMQIVCDVKEVGSTKFFRLSDSKVLSWLLAKVVHVKSILPTLDKNFSVQDEKDTLMDAVSLLGEYLKEHWLKLLCDHLQLDFQGVTRKVPSHENLPTFEGNCDSSSTLQAKTENNANSLSGSRRSQKKMKIEKDSHSIKDMFRRATRRGA